MIIPNSFQTPNLYIDRAMPYLTDSELRCLIYATRHILGWQDRIGRRRGKISLSMFEHGFTTKDGTYYAGCGLGKAAIISALKTLVENGLLIRIGVADEDGQEWELGSTDIQWGKLEQRQNKTIDAFKARTIKAREKMAEKRSGGLSDNTSNVPQTTPGLSDNTTGGLSDNTQSKPSSKPISKPAEPRKRVLSYPDTYSKWQWKHIEQYASEHITINTLACCDNAPMVKNLPTLSVARDCVELFDDLNRNGVVPHQYTALMNAAESDTSTAKYSVFRRMIYALPNWLKTAQTTVKATPSTEPKPAREMSAYELQIAHHNGVDFEWQ